MMRSEKDFNLHDLLGTYAEKIFYFCLKKTGNRHEAEDLTSDILLNAVAAVKKGVVPEHFSGWVWKIARNRYSVWVDKKHRRSQLETGLGEQEPEDESADLARAELLKKLDGGKVLTGFFITPRECQDEIGELICAFTERHAEGLITLRSVAEGTDPERLSEADRENLRSLTADGFCVTDTNRRPYVNALVFRGDAETRLQEASLYSGCNAQFCAFRY